MTPSLESIASRVDGQGAIALTQQLIRIESVSGNERNIAESIARYLQSHDIQPALVDVAPGRPNVFAYVGHQSTPLLFTGHTDTVPLGEGWTTDPMAGDEHEGLIYGRGACDMKAGLAAMLVGISAAHREISTPVGSISFAAVVDEEVSSLGIKDALANGLAARGAVLAEPTELQPVCAAKGNCYFSIDIRGRAAHAGSPEQGVNTISVAANIIRAVEEHNATLARRRYPLLGRPYASVTCISGGHAESAIPDRCIITVDRRLLPNETGTSALEELEAALRSSVVLAEGARFTVALDMELPAMAIAPDHPLVNAVGQASTLSGAPGSDAGGWSAACDGGHLCRAGIPTVLFGPGSIVRHAHRPDECVPEDEIVIAARTYAVLAARALSGNLPDLTNH